MVEWGVRSVPDIGSWQVTPSKEPLLRSVESNNFVIIQVKAENNKLLA